MPKREHSLLVEIIGGAVAILFLPVILVIAAIFDKQVPVDVWQAQAGCARGCRCGNCFGGCKELPELPDGL